MIKKKNLDYFFILTIFAGLPSKNYWPCYAYAELCTCNGAEVLLDDNITHCYQVENLSSGNWVAADQRCNSLGGHLAHFPSLKVYKKVLPFLSKFFDINLLLGYVVANVELQTVAKLCQENKFQGLLDDDLQNKLFVGIPDNNTRCTFLNLLDGKLHYGPCKQFNSILCDRPLQKPDYCGAVFNCIISTVNNGATNKPPIPSWQERFGSDNPTTVHLPTKIHNNSYISTIPAMNLPSHSTTMRPLTSIRNNNKTSSTKPFTTTASNIKNKSTTTVASQFTRNPQLINSTHSSHPIFLTTTRQPIVAEKNTNNLYGATTPNSNKPVVQVSTDTVTIPPHKTTVSFNHRNNLTNPVWVVNECGTTQVCKNIAIWRWCLPWWIFLILGLLLFLLLLCALSWLLHCFCCRLCLWRCQMPVAAKQSITNRETQTDDSLDDYSEAKLKTELDSGYYAENDSITKDYIPMPFPTAPVPETGVLINDGSTNEVFVEEYAPSILENCEASNAHQQSDYIDDNTTRHNNKFTENEEEGSKDDDNNLNSRSCSETESTPDYKSESDSPRPELLLLTNSAIVPPNENRRKSAVKPKTKKRKRLRTPEVVKPDKESPFTDSDMSKVSRHFTPPPFQKSFDDSLITSRSLSADYKPRLEHEGRRSRAISKATLNDSNGIGSRTVSSLSGDIKMKDPSGVNGGVVGTGMTSAPPIRWMQWSKSPKTFSDHPNAFLSNDV